MRTASIAPGHDRAISAGAPSCLADIVGDADSFFAETWGTQPQSFQCEAATRLLSPAEIWRAFDCGLLVAPYFAVLGEDGRSAVTGVTESREVLTRPMPGYGDAAAIRERFASGHTIKLNQPEHWHPGIKELVTGLRTEFRAEVRSSVFVRPPGGSRMRAHAHEAHVFVLQLDGQMDWCAGESPGRDPSGQQAVQATLLPGDVLYLPSGHPHCPNPHYAAGHGPDSLYLTIAIRPPSARNLAELALARFMTGPRVEEIAGVHHFMSIDEKVTWLRDALAEHLSGQDLGALADEAVRSQQRRGQV